MFINRCSGCPSSDIKCIAGTLTGSSSYSVKFDFVPNYVTLSLVSYGGELKTPSIIFKRTGTNKWSYVGVANIHSYYDGSGGSNLGTISTINDKGMTVTPDSSSNILVWSAFQ